MIFASNTTALGAATIPMAEGYDCAYGASMALVESARNDLNMFKAMISADYKEMGIRQESAAGYVQEAEIVALTEAVGAGIFRKIAELFKKLVAKIKAILHTFMSKINSLWMKDKEMVKKYQKELLTKRNIGKLEVKWREELNKVNPEDFIGKVVSSENMFTDQNDTINNYYKDDKEDMYEAISKAINNDLASSDTTEFAKNLEEHMLDDEETKTIDDIGLRSILTFLSDYSKNLSTKTRAFDKLNGRLTKLVNNCDKAANNAAKEDITNYNANGEDKKAEAKEKTDNARKAYDVAVVLQDLTLVGTRTILNVYKTQYKYNKAAFMKAIAANPAKLEATYLDAVAEAAEDEVDAVIDKAMTSEEISQLSAASTNVMDADVSDDPDKLTYGPNQYTKNQSFTGSDGSIDTDINSKSEAAYFGQLLW